MDILQNNNRKGLSLIEVVVSSLLVGLVIVGALSMLGASVRSQGAVNELLDGPRYAEQLLAEIMAMPLEDPDVDGMSGATSTELDVEGPGRTGFDDVEDYDNWSGDPVQTKDGTAIPEAAGWTRSVNTWRASLNSGNNSLFSMRTGLVGIRVQATSPTGVVTERSTMRSVWGALEQVSVVDKTVVTQVHTTLAVGADGEPQQRATNLLNHVEDPNETP